MDDIADLSNIRSRTLEQAEKSERAVKMCIAAAGIVEGLCLVGFLILMDFGNREHWLLLVMAFLIYGTLSAGLLAVGAYARHWALKILIALELLDQSTSTDDL